MKSQKYINVKGNKQQDKSISKSKRWPFYWLKNKKIKHFKLLKIMKVKKKIKNKSALK